MPADRPQHRSVVGRPGPPDAEPIGRLLAATAKAVTRAFDSVMVAHGGSLTTWQVLLSVEAGGHGKQRELARALGIEDATLTHHLNRMETVGMVTRRRDPDNRRIQHVELTDDGDRLFHHLLEHVIDFDRRLRTGVTSDEEQALRQLLDRLRLNVAGQPATRRSGASSSVDR